MKALKAKLQNKEYMQDMFVEVVGDIIMIILGLVLGYILKNYIM